MTSKRAQWISAAAVLLLFVGLLLFWGRCTLVNQEAALAKLRVENRSPSSWRIEFSRQGATSKEVLVAPWDTLEIPLKAGDYRVIQTLLDEHGHDGHLHVFDLTLSRGKVYQWPLVTLLAPPAKSGGAP